MSSAPPDSDVLVRVENVSKKFCRSLKKSLWYGVTDVASALNPFSSSSEEAQGTKHKAQSTKNIPLRLDEFWAVQNVSFELRRGECLGLIGHNGAGKSTLLKVLNGLIPPDSGSITMKGRVCALIELNAGFNPILSGRENIFNQAALLGFSKEETLTKFDAIVEFAEIGDFLDMPVQNYSSGMRVRLGFAVAAQMEPDVLIIDEVLAVGDVAFRFKCLNAIGELMKTSAVIFVTHTMPQVFRICSEVIVLDHGKVTSQTQNIADGVAVYLSMFKTGGGNVSGSSEARLCKFLLDNGTEQAGLGDTLESTFGQSLKLNATLELDAFIRNARVQFLLWNAEMLPVLDIVTNDLNGFLAARAKDGCLAVTAALPKVELNAGKYSLSVIVCNEDMSRVLCRHDNAAFIQIVAASASGAYSLAVAEWSTAPVTAQPALQSS
jgi:lipopolysaccharide transport system ATP-binding protein